jgi:hypothetical protein
MAAEPEEPFYLDFEAVRYRVHDTSFAAGRHRRLPLGSPRANYRIFVTATGERRAYQIKRGERAACTTAELVRQLKEAQFLGSTPFDPGTRGPR